VPARRRLPSFEVPCKVWGRQLLAGQRVVQLWERMLDKSYPQASKLES
jgi:hypothetical protein